MPRIGIGLGLRHKGSGVDWASYWANSGLFEFFGQTKNISGGRLNNEVIGTTDYLTVAGVAGSETYQAPNNPTYIADDTDYIWFKTDVTRRTTTTAELIGYDFTRTIVKYGNTAPYLIEAIMILSANVDTAKMRDDFDLSIWWSNVSSDHGMTKGNRSAEKSIWYSEPNAPSGLILSVLSATSIKVDFTDNSDNETAFLIERSTPAEAGYALIHTNAPGVVTWTDTTNLASTTYYYRVRAVNTSQYSAYCASAFATTIASIILQDSFTDVNATHLHDHVMNAGAGWTEVSGVWEINTNQVRQTTSDTAVKCATAESGTANHDVSIDIKTNPANGNFANGLFFRYQNAANN